MGLITEFKKIKRISLGLSVLLLQLFLFINIEAFFPESMAAGMERLIATYLLVYVVMFAIPDLRSRLFDEPASKLTQYISAFIIGAIFFSTMANFFIGGRYQQTTTIVTAISTVALSMVLVHTIIIAWVEEHFFRDFVNNKVGAFWSSLFFGFFHYSVYQFHLLQILIAALMGYFFLILKRRFSPRTNLVNISVHAAFNVVMTGVLYQLTGGLI